MKAQATALVDKELLSDETFIYPVGIEMYSTNGDHLPLPPGRRKDLDQHFYGEQLESDDYLHQGYERDPLYKLPLMARMQANIYKHRCQAKHVGWDVAAVLSLNRESFGPKGPLEVESEHLIFHASRGDAHEVSVILKSGLVDPDVADSHGHTALIAATVNCHNDVIQLLLDMGADVDKLNSEGMSALAVCHVLYYPFCSLQPSFTQSPERTRAVTSSFGNNSLNSQQSFSKDTPEPHTTPRTFSSCSQLSDQEAEKQIRDIFQHSSTNSDDSELTTERFPDLHEETLEQSELRENVGGSKQEEKMGAEGQELEAESVKSVEEVTLQPKKQSFSSVRSLCSYTIDVTQQMMELSAEALSRTGRPQHSDTEETVRKMAAMKIQHKNRLKTLKLLLKWGANPNVSRIPMPVLFLAIMAADAKAVERLLLHGARTDIPLTPERKGLYPLHVAAALPGSAGHTITQLLLQAVSDPNVQACDQDEVYEPDRSTLKAQKPLRRAKRPRLKEGGRTPLHVACQRDRDFENATKVVAYLLSHGASTDLLWSGHSPLSLAIANGNERAVEELLKRGADPNIPLGRAVGSALCAVANVNYNLGLKRQKLLEMLAEAGANILMPIRVGDVVGTAVDYAHNCFNQDPRIANTPFHTLSAEERESFVRRRQLLSLMGDLLRQAAHKKDMEEREKEEELKLNGISEASGLPGPDGPHTKEEQREQAFKFCYHCGRTASVKLTACTRCNKVFYCSTDCKLRAWAERHKDECIREPSRVQASAENQREESVIDLESENSNQKRVMFRIQKGLKLINARYKFKTINDPVLTKPEFVMDLEENYSRN
ncbi:ankyrin repeat and MYND domain-containing protein 1 isoform X2 [Cynoglossus semilaevis]|nr:ankyrin repeat and MYND domain-containing protein 1 isoform X2 [Cynoglossus semilaevis]